MFQEEHVEWIAEWFLGRAVFWSSTNNTALSLSLSLSLSLYIYIYTHTYTYIYTGCFRRNMHYLGNDSMSDSKQKRNMNMGPILNGYGVMTVWNLE